MEAIDGPPLTVIVPGLPAFLKDYPHMSIRPASRPGLVIQGPFHFTARHKGYPEITDSFVLRIAVPPAFPGDLPEVTKLGKRIPHNGDFHVNPDATLCLGSPLRLLWKLSRRPSLPGFASSCLVPYLYAVSHKLQFGGELLFRELKHGAEGIVEDYLDLFGLSNPEQVRRVVRLLGMKKRHANKEPCPCECGNRLGRCRFNRKMRYFRQRASRSWFRAHQI